MDSSLSMLLPKGIVTNSATIYQEVANYPIIPADKIYQYWHVYTTTNKKLQDPTARRLENFWWQVWGSDRRNLSGRALARIFEDISLGPTAVPLKGPENRWEGPDAILARLRSIVLPPQEQDLASVASPANTSSGTISSTSSRAQHQPHPILKKVRGPSTSGKRPTARFVSPHGSPDHDDEDSDSFSSGSTAVTGVDVQQTASSNLKKPSVTSMPAKPTAPVPKSQKQATQQNQNNTQPPSRQKALSSPYNAASAQQTSQATASKGSHTKQPSSLSKAHTSPKPDDSRHARTQPQNPAANKQGSISTNDRVPAVRTHGRHSSGLLPAIEHAVPMRRSQSSTSSERPREISTTRAPPQALFTGATASTTKIAAQGTIIEESGAYGGSVVDSATLNDPEYAGYTLQQTASSTSLLDSARFTPTQPSSFASLPLGRTKSQLTLLLEREKERSRDHSHRH